MIELRVSEAAPLSLDAFQQTIIDGAKYENDWDEIVLNYHPDLEEKAKQIAGTLYQIDGTQSAGSIGIQCIAAADMKPEEWKTCFMKKNGDR